MMIRKISSAIVLSFILITLMGCNTEDDVLEIFLGKTWKLTYIATEDSHAPFDFWGDGKSGEHYAEALEGENAFILNFEGTDFNGTTGGTFNARALTATINGNWNANGDSKDMTTNNVEVSHSESNALAQAFIRGLQNAIRYGGDSSNLYIYYEDNDNTIKRMNFIAR